MSNTLTGIQITQQAQTELESGFVTTFYISGDESSSPISSISTFTEGISSIPFTWYAEQCDSNGIAVAGGDLTHLYGEYFGNWRPQTAPVMYNLTAEDSKQHTFRIWPLPTRLYLDDETRVFCGTGVVLSNTIPYITLDPTILSGTWVNPAGTQSGYVSGTIDFNTKTIFVDLSSVTDNSAFTDGNSAMRLKHKAVYGLTNWGITYPVLTTGSINISSDIDNVNFSLTGVVTDAQNNVGYYTPTAVNVFLFPYHVDILQNNYFYQYASLSATLKSRNTNYNLNDYTPEEYFGGGDGSAKIFTGTTDYSPVIPGSMSVTGGIPITGGNGEYIFRDLGTGVLTGASVSAIYYDLTGTIDYTFGNYKLDFRSQVLTTDQRIKGEYVYNNRYIGWKAQPVGGGVNRLSAVLLDDGNKLISLSTILSSQALTTQNIMLTSNSNTAQVYSVSCFLADPGTSLSIRIPATTLFSYEPIRQDTLEILKVSAGNVAQEKQILQMSRVIATDLGRYYSSPSGSFMWSSSASGPVAITSLTAGLVPADLNITTYLSSFPIPSIVTPGISATVNYYGASSTTVTATDVVYGPEYVAVQFPLNTGQTFILSGCYPDAWPNSVTTYTWKEYTPPSAIRINVDYLDNQPFIRTAQVKVWDYTTGVDKPIHYFNKIAWDVSVNAASGGVWATETNGTPYNLGLGLPTNDTLILYLSTITFDNTPGNSAQYVSFSVHASAININTVPYVTETSGTEVINVDTFPAANLFNTSFTFNYEQTGTSDVWRLTSTSYPFNVTDKTIIPADVVVSGVRSFNIYGTPFTVVHHDTVTGTFNASTPNIETITLVAAGVSGQSWLDSHNLSATQLNTHFIGRFLSTDFILYPSYVFYGDVAATPLNASNYTLSRGVCAYNHGHVETFNLSARESAGTYYQWSVNGNNAITPVQESTVDISDSVNVVGIPVTLSVFNDDLPVNMSPYYYADDGSGLTLYPNISAQTPSGDFSNNLFQAIRMAPYETPVLAISSLSTDIVVPIPGYNQLKALNVITYPVSSPVHAQIGTTIWTISSQNWSNVVTRSGSTLNYTLSVGDDSSVPGFIKYGNITDVSIYSQVDIGSTIPYTPPFDWEIVYSVQQSTPEVISVSAAPNISIFTDQQFALTGDTVQFENLTLNSPPGLISGFIWYDGYNPTYQTTSFDPFFTSYAVPGVYSVTLSAVTVQGFVYSRTFTDIITIEPLVVYDVEVVRVFGITELKFPYTLYQCRVPPNEWLTYNNMNNAFSKMLSNITYLKDVSKFYSPPPKYFIGWLGSTVNESLTAFHWNVNISQLNTDYSSLTGALLGNVLTAVNDIAYKDDTLYIADGATMQILSGNYAATPISKLSEKNVGDPFIELKAISVDTDTRIYALDAPKNRVVVFTYSSNQIPNWKLLFSWGTLGGQNSRTGFNNPNDLFVDANNILWVVDTGNSCIKKYTRTGSWLQTYTSEYFKGNDVSNGGPISVTLDSDGFIYVLVNDGIVKLDSNGDFIAKYYFALEVTNAIKSNTNIIPKRIRTSSQGGFVYVTFTDRVVKITTSGLHGGTFANNFNGIVNFTSAIQNEFGDLFITNQNTILKFADENVILSVYKQSSFEWSSDDIYVDKNEFIQPWVINRSLARIWDNIELFRRSITGKIIFTTLINNISGYQVQDFTPTEYVGMQITDKSDIFVGVNEMVTRDVFNRCIDKLYADITTVLSYL